MPRPAPPNALNISIAPWRRFTAFELDTVYLLPIFNIGRFALGVDGCVTLPLAVHANHAACDGFHTAQLYKVLQADLDT